MLVLRVVSDVGCVPCATVIVYSVGGDMVRASVRLSKLYKSYYDHENLVCPAILLALYDDD